MNTRQVWQRDAQGRPVRQVAVPVIVTQPKPKYSRLVLPLAFVVFVVVSIFLNAAQYEVSEEVPAPIYLDGAR